MAQIHAVRGPLDTADLGQSYMHKCIFVRSADKQRNYPQEWGQEDDRAANPHRFFEG